MALPAKEKTWRSNINRKRSLTSNLVWHQTVMFDLHRALIGADGLWDTTPTSKWTVYQSSDSVSAGTEGDGVDRWDAYTDLTWDRPGDAHSWVVYNTGMNNGTAQVCINLDNNNTSSVNTVPESINVTVSWGGLFTGGTTTNRPTATDLSTDITRSPTVGHWAGNFTGNGDEVSWHLMMSDDGAEVRWVLMYQNIPIAFMGMGELVNPNPSSTRPGWGVWYSVNNTDVCDLDNTSNCFLYYNETWAHFQYSLCTPVALNVLGNASELWSTGTYAGKGNESENGEAFGQIWLWDTDSVGNRGPKGRIKDTYIVRDFYQNGDTFPDDGSRQWHKVGGNIVLPWNGVAPENAY